MGASKHGGPQYGSQRVGLFCLVYNYEVGLELVKKVGLEVGIWPQLQIGGPYCGRPRKKGPTILGSILGPPNSGKLPHLRVAPNGGCAIAPS